MLTILRPTTTTQWLPTGNPIVYTLNENAYLGSNLMALVTVYANSEPITNLKYPLTVNENMYVDVHDVLHNAMSSTFVNEATQMVSPASEWVEYKIGVREQYFDVNGEQHITGEAVTPANYAWYSAAPFEYDIAVTSFIKLFEPSASNPMRPLAVKTTFDALPALWVNRTVRRINPAVIDKAYVLKHTTRQTETFCFNDGTTRYANYLVVYVFGKDKPNYLSKKFILDVSAMPNTTAWKFASIPVGAQQLNDFEWTTVVKLNPEEEDFIDPNTDAYYAVAWTLNSYDSLQRTETPVSTYTLFALDFCNKDEYRILYKSTEGGWWQVRAHLKHYKADSIKSSVMTNRFYASPSVDMRYRKAVGVEAESTLTLNTDYLTQGDVFEVEDMLLSPDIWIVKNGLYIPATLTDSEYIISDVGQDKLANYELNFKIESPNTLR